KVGEGEPTEEITKQPVDEIIEYGPTPDEPGNPDQPTPDEPGNPDQSKNVNHSTINKDHLPDTGDNSKSNQGILAGSLLSILGSLFIFGRRKNKDNSEK
ncbi:LPXTG cell wall anchor domain-containing protein, partial [Staphylococcus epidermidis]|uniref:LPXTG cell wall anchor domain-containing protein n=1 Tax=Staphylococcus epidermidis TaxID=1282 RepID=UPI000B190999